MNRRFSTAVLTGSAGLICAMFRTSPAAAHELRQDAALDTWRPSRRARPRLAAHADCVKLAGEVWNSYGLTWPNSYDTADAFCQATTCIRRVR